MGTACDEPSTVITNNVVPTCDNGILDGDEDEIDCDGSCESSCGSICQDSFELGSICTENSACLSVNCINGVCTCPERQSAQNNHCVAPVSCENNPCGDNASCSDSDEGITCNCNEGFDDDVVNYVDIDLFILLNEIHKDYYLAIVSGKVITLLV